jgi:hypothetical protein
MVVQTEKHHVTRDHSLDKLTSFFFKKIFYEKAYKSCTNYNNREQTAGLKLTIQTFIPLPTSPNLGTKVSDFQTSQKQTLTHLKE